MPSQAQVVTGGDVQQIISVAQQAIYNIQGAVNSAIYAGQSGINNTYYNAANGINNAIYNLNSNVYGAIGNINGQINRIADNVNYRINVSNTDTVNRINNYISASSGATISALQAAIGSSTGVISSRISAVDDHIGRTEKIIIDGIRDVGKGVNISTEEFKKMLAESTKKLYETAYIASNNAASGLRSVILDSLDEQVRELDKTGAGIRQHLDDNLAIVNGAIVSNRNLTIAELQRGLGDILKAEQSQGNAFQQAISDAIMQVLKSLHDFLLSTGKDIDKLFIQLRPILDKISNNRYHNFDELLKDLQVGSDVLPFVKIVVGIFSLVPAFNHLVNNGISPVGRTLEQLSNVAVRGSLLGVEDYVKAYHQGLISREKLNDKLSKYGLTDSDQIVLTMSTAPRVTVDSLRQLYLRGDIDEKTLDLELRTYGYDERDIKRLKTLFYPIPDPQDLIRFAVREVFSPEVAKKFGLFEDFPEQFADFAEQVGLTREWAKRYWGAHWELPSPQMGYEMFQRRIIDKPTLEMLLKALDVMPYWRDKLIQLNYNPLTRVDVRRMYGEGILSEKDVYNAYLDIGYSPKNAEALKEFTVKIESDDPDIKAAQIRTMTKSVISKAYEKGAITRPDAKLRLKTVGYSEKDSELILDLIDFEIEIVNRPDRRQDYIKRMITLVKNGYSRGLMSYDESFNTLVSAGFTENEARTELSYEDYEYSSKLRQYVVDYIKAAYSENTIDINDAKNTLRAYGFSANEIDKIINECNIISATRTKKPTLADIQKFYKLGILSDAEFIEELRGLGYHDKYVWMYYTSTSQVGK